jgi:pimeloyl-ACP methyl ester carboxylesterase
MESLLVGPEAASALAERNAAFGPAIAAAKAGELKDAARLMLVAIMNQGDAFWDATPDDVRAMVLENARTLPLFFSAPPAPPLTCEQLSEIKLPTLVINGAQSLSYYKYVGQRVAECIPGSRRELIPGATHGPHDQNSSHFTRVLLDFIGAGP